MLLFSFVLEWTGKKNLNLKFVVSLLSISWTSWVRGNSRWKRRKIWNTEMMLSLSQLRCILTYFENVSSHWKKVKLFSAMRRDCFAFISFLDFVNFLSFLILQYYHYTCHYTYTCIIQLLVTLHFSKVYQQQQQPQNAV